MPLVSGRSGWLQWLGLALRIHQVVLSQLRLGDLRQRSHRTVESPWNLLLLLLRLRLLLRLLWLWLLLRLRLVLRLVSRRLLLRRLLQRRLLVHLLVRGLLRL